MINSIHLTFYCWFYVIVDCQRFYFVFIIFVDTVQSTVDTTKNVAASAFDKGTAIVGAAKGNL